MTHRFYVQGELSHNGMVVYAEFQSKDGHRFRHEKQVPECDVKEIEAQVNELNANMEKGIFPNFICDWLEKDPAYGSVAHQKMGDLHLMDNEEREHYFKSHRAV